MSKSKPKLPKKLSAAGLARNAGQQEFQIAELGYQWFEPIKALKGVTKEDRWEAERIYSEAMYIRTGTLEAVLRVRRANEQAKAEQMETAAARV